MNLISLISRIVLVSIIGTHTIAVGRFTPITVAMFGGIFLWGMIEAFIESDKSAKEKGFWRWLAEQMARATLTLMHVLVMVPPVLRMIPGLMVCLVLELLGLLLKVGQGIRELGVALVGVRWKKVLIEMGSALREVAKATGTEAVFGGMFLFIGLLAFTGPPISGILTVVQRVALLVSGFLIAAHGFYREQVNVETCALERAQRIAHPIRTEYRPIPGAWTFTHCSGASSYDWRLK